MPQRWKLSMTEATTPSGKLLGFDSPCLREVAEGDELEWAVYRCSDIDPILDALPSTADGVKLYLGMTVFWLSSGGRIQEMTVARLGRDVVFPEINPVWAISPSDLFSTRAAAVAELARRREQ